MNRAALLAFAVFIAPACAFADCQDDVAKAYDRAATFPPTFGRAALQEQIQRAENAHHEGDEESCREELSAATDVLNQIDAYRREHPAATDDDRKG